MRILIAYDGSECADTALEDLQRAFPMYVPEGIKRAHERARHKLEQAEDLAKRSLFKSSRCFRRGLSSRALLVAVVR